MREYVKDLGKMQLYISQGFIIEEPADALMTAVNALGHWRGGVDRAIEIAAGSKYHEQLRAAMPFRDLEIVVAKGNSAFHIGAFDNVIFVVDEVISSLDKVVYSGLTAAHREGYSKVIMPTIRMGIMIGRFERTPKETIERMATRINRFVEDNRETSLQDLTIFVYQNPAVAQLLRETL